MPGQNNRGINAAIVVKVEAMIIGGTFLMQPLYMTLLTPYPLVFFFGHIQLQPQPHRQVAQLRELIQTKQPY